LKTEVSIVIPCYNEDHRLEPRLSEALRFYSENFPRGLEFIFVDDGSKDGTRMLLESAQARHPQLAIRIISYAPNRGKGFAVKTGMLAAAGEKVITMDADFSIDIRETQRFIDALDTADVAVGTKKHELTESVKHQSPFRRFLGKGFTRLTNIVLRMNFTDITCGMKAFRSEANRRIFGMQRLERWAYDSEILFLAKRLGYTSIEIPVRWAHIDGSKISAVKDSLRSLKELVIILKNYYSGKYKDGRDS